MPRGRKPKTSAGSGVVGSLQAARAELAAQRGAVDRQIAAVDAALSAFGAAGGGGGARVGGGARAVGRPKGSGARTAGVRKGSLKEYLLRVLNSAGGVMAVKDITSAVLRAGYKSKNQTLAKSVGIALTETPGVKKVGRGKFKAA